MASSSSLLVQRYEGKTCWVCARQDGIRVCGKCHAVGYCSLACQTEHWRAGHKQTCSQPSAIQQFEERFAAVAGDPVTLQNPTVLAELAEEATRVTGNLASALHHAMDDAEEWSVSLAQQEQQQQIRSLRDEMAKTIADHDTFAHDQIAAEVARAAPGKGGKDVGAHRLVADHLGRALHEGVMTEHLRNLDHIANAGTYADLFSDSVAASLGPDEPLTPYDDPVLQKFPGMATVVHHAMHLFAERWDTAMMAYENVPLSMLTGTPLDAPVSMPFAMNEGGTTPRRRTPSGGRGGGRGGGGGAKPNVGRFPRPAAYIEIIWQEIRDKNKWTPSAEATHPVISMLNPSNLFQDRIEYWLMVRTVEWAIALENSWYPERKEKYAGLFPHDDGTPRKGGLIPPPREGMTETGEQYHDRVKANFIKLANFPSKGVQQAHIITLRIVEVIAVFLVHMVPNMLFGGRWSLITFPLARFLTDLVGVGTFFDIQRILGGAFGVMFGNGLIKFKAMAQALVTSPASVTEKLEFDTAVINMAEGLKNITQINITTLDKDAQNTFFRQTLAYFRNQERRTVAVGTVIGEVSKPTDLFGQLGLPEWPFSANLNNLLGRVTHGLLCVLTEEATTVALAYTAINIGVTDAYGSYEGALSQPLPVSVYAGAISTLQIVAPRALFAYVRLRVYLEMLNKFVAWIAQAEVADADAFEPRDPGARVFDGSFNRAPSTFGAYARIFYYPVMRYFEGIAHKTYILRPLYAWVHARNMRDALATRFSNPLICAFVTFVCIDIARALRTSSTLPTEWFSNLSLSNVYLTLMGIYSATLSERIGPLVVGVTGIFIDQTDPANTFTLAVLRIVQILIGGGLYVGFARLSRLNKLFNWIAKDCIPSPVRKLYRVIVYLLGWALFYYLFAGSVRAIGDLTPMTGSMASFAGATRLGAAYLTISPAVAGEKNKSKVMNAIARVDK